MFRRQMDVRIKLMILPFVEMDFYHQDDLASLVKAVSDPEEYANIFARFAREKLYPLINRQHHIHNLDEIELLWQYYFPKKHLVQAARESNGLSRFYLDYLTKISNLFITHRNGILAFKHHAQGMDESFLGPYKGINKVALWNSLNRMMNTDVLAMLYLLDNDMTDDFYLESYRAHIHLEDVQLDQVLAEGVAETHMHFNAGRYFALNWQAYMSPHTVEAKELHHMPNPILMKKVDRAQLVAMAVVRILLAAFLVEADGRFQKGEALRKYYPDDTGGGKGEGKPINLIQVMKMIENGKVLTGEDTYHELYDVYEQLIQEKGLLLDDEDDWKTSIQYTRRDILYELFRAPYGDYHVQNLYSIEHLFLFRALRYMKLTNPDDEFFAKLFWQYIRIKNEVFQTQVQYNHIRGLDHFRPYFDRATDARLSRDPARKFFYLLKSQTDNDYMQKMEIRFPPQKSSHEGEMKKEMALDMLVFLHAYLEIIRECQQQKRQAPAIGIVYHFIKRRDRRDTDKCWMNFKEFGEDAYLHFKELQQQYALQLDVIRELRETVPRLSHYIVGIDAASVEKWTEPWVFAPIFQNARDSKKHKLRYTKGDQPEIQSLGFTYHVGEDFRHLLSGLRHVDEVLEHFHFQAGDRIGHGAVLGIKPEQWMKRNMVVILPRIEHLENVLWMWGLYKNGESMQYLDFSHLEQEILDLAKQIYQKLEGITVYQLWLAYQSKFQRIFDEANSPPYAQSDEIESELFCKFVHPEHGQMWNEQKLMYAQHCKCYLDLMMEPIQVEVRKEELSLLEELQKIVVQKVSRKGIVIETNPSSNTAITEIENIFEHYIQHLNQRGLQSNRQAENGVIVTINTDDPVVFNTNINNEFAYIFYSLEEKGYARQDILEWIDMVRKNGLRTSFVHTRQMSNDDRIKEICALIEAIKKALDE